MATISGFTMPAQPWGDDLGPKAAVACGKTITGWQCFAPPDAAFTGPNLVAGDKPSIQTMLNGYVYDPTYTLTIKFVVSLNGVPADVWTNLPLALTEMPNSRIRIPLYGVSYIRMTTNVGVAGTASTLLMVRASIDNGVTWTTVPNSPQVSAASTGLKVSSLVAVPASFQTDVLASIWGQGGDGVADPTFGLTTIQGA